MTLKIQGNVFVSIARIIHKKMPKTIVSSRNSTIGEMYREHFFEKHLDTKFSLSLQFYSM